jgi:SPP1 gp7 family putative phage head morphogenesis protein
MSTLRDQLPSKIRRRGGRVPRQRVPMTIALAYLTDLRKITADAGRLVNERVLPVVRELIAARTDAACSACPDLLGEHFHHVNGQTYRLDAWFRSDASRDPAGRINKLMDRVSAAFYRKWDHDRMSALAAKYARATSDYQKAQLAGQIQARLGIDPVITTPGLGQKIKAAVGDQVAMIKSIPQNYFDQVEKRIIAGFRAGDRHEEIAADLGERLGVAESRAKLIARDQTLKLYGEVNRERQQALGFTRYVWQDVNDQRVRDAHGPVAEGGFAGGTYSWDDPPGDGSPEEGTHPGTAINCRCWADPVFDDVLPGADDVDPDGG